MLKNSWHQLELQSCENKLELPKHIIGRKSMHQCCHHYHLSHPAVYSKLDKAFRKFHKLNNFFGDWYKVTIIKYMHV